MRKHLTVMLLILFCISLPVFAGEKWGRDGAWGRADPRWGRGLDEWTLEDLPYIVDWWRIEEGVEADSNNTTADSGDVVFFWRGSINGMALAQGINSRRPEYRTDQINSQSALVFDGIDDWLQVEFGAEYAQPNTVIFICSEPTNTTGNREMIDGFEVGKRHVIRQHGTGDNYRWLCPANLTSSVSITAGNPWHIWIGVANGVSSLLRMDGNQVASGNAGTEPLNGLTIAARYGGYLHADISVTDVVVISALIGAGDLQRVERWLNEHRGGIF